MVANLAVVTVSLTPLIASLEFAFHSAPSFWSLLSFTRRTCHRTALYCVALRSGPYPQIMPLHRPHLMKHPLRLQMSFPSNKSGKLYLPLEAFFRGTIASTWAGIMSVYVAICQLFEPN
jgi:hypothetical protein